MWKEAFILKIFEWKLTEYTFMLYARKISILVMLIGPVVSGSEHRIISASWTINLYPTQQKLGHTPQKVLYNEIEFKGSFQK